MGFDEDLEEIELGAESAAADGGHGDVERAAAERGRAVEAGRVRRASRGPERWWRRRPALRDSARRRRRIGAWGRYCGGRGWAWIQSRNPRERTGRTK